MKIYFNSNISEVLGLGDTNKIDSQTTEIVELQFVAGSEGMGVFFGCRFFNFIFIVLWIMFGCLYVSILIQHFVSLCDYAKTQNLWKSVLQQKSVYCPRIQKG